jgi:hypothetical protein
MENDEITNGNDELNASSILAKLTKKPENVASKEEKKPRPMGEAPSVKEQNTALAKTANDLFSALSPDTGNISPRGYGYAAGAALGPAAKKLLSPFSSESSQARSVSNAEKTLDLAAREEKIKKINELVNRGMSVSQAQILADQPFEFAQRTIKNAPAPRNYVQAMANTDQAVPNAVLEGVTDYKQGYQVAQQQRELDDLANKVAKRHGFGGYELTGEGVPPSTRPAQIGRVTPIFDVPPETAATSVASAAAEEAPSLTSRVGQAVSRPVRYVSNVLRHPVVKSALTGAGIVGSGLQAASDVANKDWVGLGIDAAQAGLTPVAPIASGLTAEALRWSREHPAEFEKAVHEAYLRGSSPR